MLVNFSGVEGLLVSEKKNGFVVFTSSRKRAIHKKSVIYVQSYCITKKNALYLGVNVFRTEVLIWDTILRLQLETGPPELQIRVGHGAMPG